MTFLETVERSTFLLSDGGIETRIAFETDIHLDPEMGVARLVEDERGKAALEGIYRQYLDVGRRYHIPMQVGTPTFRAGPMRLRRAGLTGPDDLERVHGECVRLLALLREGLGDYRKKVFIAGVVAAIAGTTRSRNWLSISIRLRRKGFGNGRWSSAAVASLPAGSRA